VSIEPEAMDFCADIATTELGSALGGGKKEFTEKRDLALRGRIEAARTEEDLLTNPVKIETNRWP
jgi:hypothetical protein